MSDLELSDNESISLYDNEPTFTKKKGFDDTSDKNKELYNNIDLDESDVDESDVDDSDIDDSDIDDSDIDDSDVDDSIVNNELDNEENTSYNGGNLSKTVIKPKKTTNIINTLPNADLDVPLVFEKNEEDYISDDEEEEDDDYLQKFDNELRENYISTEHPECIINNYDEIYNLATVQRNKDNIIIDNLHKTIPILTKYEKTKILGLRTKQLNNGAKPYVNVNNNIIDGYLIALAELEEKKIPFIIRRPMPSGASEYWHLYDLEII